MHPKCETCLHKDNDSERTPCCFCEGQNKYQPNDTNFVELGHQELQVELTEFIILKEAQIFLSPHNPDFREYALGLYNNDYVLRKKIQGMVSGVMQIVQKHRKGALDT